MHALVVVGHDCTRPHNIQLMQRMLEDGHGVTIKVGLVAGHIFPGVLAMVI